MIKLPSGRSTYFPAAGPQFEGTYWKQDINSYSFKWFKEGKSFFHYPFMLTNAFNNIKNADYRLCHTFPRDDNHILIGDSGGFQIMSYGKKGKPVHIEPVSILRWM
jgi:hypothetical protein